MRSSGCCRGTPAGTLGRREIGRVEWAFVADGELAQRYKLVREELAETIALNDKLGRHRRALCDRC
jgi:hypothetical protein